MFYIIGVVVVVMVIAGVWGCADDPSVETANIRFSHAVERGGQLAFSVDQLMGWWAILAATRRRMGKVSLSALAAGAAFQALLYLFPTLTAVVSLYGLVPDPTMVERK